MILQKHINSIFSFWILFVILSGVATAKPSTFTTMIRIDLFGYFPESEKVAVISNPVVGYNAPGTYQPAETLEVRLWDTDEVVFTGPVQAWKAGFLHAQSGDRGWWFDFSAVTQPGSYYIYDTEAGVGSYPFLIAPEVYNTVLKIALRTFFIQRLSQDKSPPYIESKWADAPAYDGPDQDRQARNRWNKEDASTARD
jgi:endoglucanase